MSEIIKRTDLLQNNNNELEYVREHTKFNETEKRWINNIEKEHSDEILEKIKNGTKLEMKDGTKLNVREISDLLETIPLTPEATKKIGKSRPNIYILRMQIFYNNEMNRSLSEEGLFGKQTSYIAKNYIKFDDAKESKEIFQTETFYRGLGKYDKNEILYGKSIDFALQGFFGGISSSDTINLNLAAGVDATPTKSYSRNKGKFSQRALSNKVSIIIQKTSFFDKNIQSEVSKFLDKKNIESYISWIKTNWKGPDYSNDSGNHRLFVLRMLTGLESFLDAMTKSGKKEFKLNLGFNAGKCKPGSLKYPLESDRELTVDAKIIKKETDENKVESDNKIDNALLEIDNDISKAVKEFEKYPENKEYVKKLEKTKENLNEVLENKDVSDIEKVNELKKIRKDFEEVIGDFDRNLKNNKEKTIQEKLKKEADSKNIEELKKLDKKLDEVIETQEKNIKSDDFSKENEQEDNNKTKLRKKIEVKNTFEVQEKNKALFFYINRLRSEQKEVDDGSTKILRRYKTPKEIQQEKFEDMVKSNEPASTQKVLYKYYQNNWEAPNLIPQNLRSGVYCSQQVQNILGGYFGKRTLRNMGLGTKNAWEITNSLEKTGYANVVSDLTDLVDKKSLRRINRSRNVFEPKFEKMVDELYSNKKTNHCIVNIHYKNTLSDRHIKLDKGHTPNTHTSFNQGPTEREITTSLNGNKISSQLISFFGKSLRGNYTQNKYLLKYLRNVEYNGKPLTRDSKKLEFVDGSGKIVRTVKGGKLKYTDIQLVHYYGEKSRVNGIVELTMTGKLTPIQALAWNDKVVKDKELDEQEYEKDFLNWERSPKRIRTKEELKKVLKELYEKNGGNKEYTFFGGKKKTSAERAFSFIEQANIFKPGAGLYIDKGQKIPLPNRDKRPNGVTLFNKSETPENIWYTDLNKEKVGFDLNMSDEAMVAMQMEYQSTKPDLSKRAKIQYLLSEIYKKNETFLEAKNIKIPEEFAIDGVFEGKTYDFMNKILRAYGKKEVIVEGGNKFYYYAMEDIYEIYKKSVGPINNKYLTYDEINKSVDEGGIKLEGLLEETIPRATRFQMLKDFCLDLDPPFYEQKNAKFLEGYLKLLNKRKSWYSLKYKFRSFFDESYGKIIGTLNNLTTNPDIKLSILNALINETGIVGTGFSDFEFYGEINLNYYSRENNSVGHYQIRPSMALTYIYKFGTPEERKKYGLPENVTIEDRRKFEAGKLPFDEEQYGKIGKDLVSDISFATKICYFAFIDKVPNFEREFNTNEYDNDMKKYTDLEVNGNVANCDISTAKSLLSFSKEELENIGINKVKIRQCGDGDIKHLLEETDVKKVFGEYPPVKEGVCIQGSACSEATLLNSIKNGRIPFGIMKNGLVVEGTDFRYSTDKSGSLSMINGDPLSTYKNTTVEFSCKSVDVNGTAIDTEKPNQNQIDSFNKVLMPYLKKETGNNNLNIFTSAQAIQKNPNKRFDYNNFLKYENGKYKIIDQKKYGEYANNYSNYRKRFTIHVDAGSWGSEIYDKLLVNKDLIGTENYISSLSIQEKTKFKKLIKDRIYLSQKMQKKEGLDKNHTVKYWRQILKSL